MTAFCLVALALVAAARGQDACEREEVPDWFLPVRSDVSCASLILGAIPGEVSERAIEVKDELSGAKDLTWEAFQRSRFYQRDQHVGGRLWGSQFGNQFFFWMELTSGTALCSTLDQRVPKIFNQHYCREEIVGAPDSPGCRAFLRNRPPAGDNTAWHSWGAYAPAVAMIREEWMRAAYHVMKDTPDLDARPCVHVPALPAGASYLGVYFRCGESATSRRDTGQRIRSSIPSGSGSSCRPSPPPQTSSTPCCSGTAESTATALAKASAKATLRPWHRSCETRRGRRCWSRRKDTTRTLTSVSSATSAAWRNPSLSSTTATRPASATSLRFFTTAVLRWCPTSPLV